MAVTGSLKRSPLLCVVLLCVALLAANPKFFKSSRAQSTQLTLISQETSTRALAFDSVTQKREPFNSTSEIQWGNDNRTRIMLFVMGLDPATAASAVTADAEDGAHNHYSLTVEYVGPVPSQDWAIAVIVSLSDQMGDIGDVLMRITASGTRSNRV